MQEAQGGRADLTPEESWRTIHETVGRVKSSMYVAGTATILLLWSVIVSLGYLSQFAIASLAPGFSESNPWFPGPLWGTLATVGMVGSGIIGHRRRQAEHGGQGSSQRWHQGVPLLARCDGSGLPSPWSSGALECGQHWGQHSAGRRWHSVARVHIVRHNAPPGHRGNRRRDRGVLLYPELPRGRGRGGRFGGSHAGGSLLGAAWIHNSRVP